MRIGIDVGGSKICGVLYDESVKKKIRIKTGKTKKEVISNIKEVFEKLYDDKLTSIGIGVPGIVKNNKIVNCPNLKVLNGVNLSRVLNKKINLINDANAFLIGEVKKGVAKGKKNVVGLTIGTGIGSGIIIEKKLYEGHNFMSGEIGHLNTSPFSNQTYEKQWSGKGLENIYFELTGNKKSFEEIFEEKSKESKIVISYAIQGIAYLCSIFSKLLDPEIIVIGGGVSNLPIYPRLNKELKKFHKENRTKIVKNKLGDYSGAIGAALA